MRDPMSEDGGAAPAPAVHRLSAWLRRRGRTRPSAPADPPERPADPPAPPPPSRLRPQPEDDASVYPLF